MVGFSDIVCGRYTASALHTVSCPASRRACSRLDDIEPFRFDSPSLMHVMLPESLRQSRGPGIATPARLLPSDIPPHLRPLSSTGITRRLQSYGPLRHPGGPACPSRGSRWCVHTTDRASRVATSSLFHTCRRHYPGGNGPVRLSLLFPAVVGLPLFSAGSASALLFSRPAQRSLSLRPVWSLNRPRRPFDTRVLRPTSLPP